MMVPEFRKGDVLRAADLNVLADGVRRLAGDGGDADGGFRQGVRRLWIGRRFGFQLAEVHGVLWFRQGWVDAGNGRFLRVGKREWNVIGKFRAGTIWLELDVDVLRAAAEGPADDMEVGKVVMGDYDEVTPERSLRRRLGYVRPLEGDGFACVQVLGGLVSPCAPRRMMGVAWNGVEPVAGSWKKCDDAWHFRHAGAVTGTGYTAVVSGVEVDVPPARVGMCWECAFSEVFFPAVDGGRRFASVMQFG